MFDELTNDGLLDALDEERRKFIDSDKARIRSMIDELIRRGVYPAETVPDNPNDVYTMVSGWGARWIEWGEPHACRHCGADLRDHRVGPPFKREIGHYDRAQDRTVGYTCPDCKQDLRAHAWNRVLDGTTPES